jgi:hypothetical protein
MNKKILTVVDVLLFHDLCQRNNFIGARKTQLYLTSHTCLRRNRRVQSVNFNTSRLSHLLVKSAVENLTAYGLSVSRNFNSVHGIVTSYFQAMYAYKCGSYEKCLSLCENIVADPMRISFVGMMLVKESDLLYLMDDESLSLIGLAKLCGVFDLDLHEVETVIQWTLLVYLLVQCKLRLKHPPATFIDTLRFIMTTCRYRSNLIVNCSLLILVYRKVIKGSR